MRVFLSLPLSLTMGVPLTACGSGGADPLQPPEDDADLAEEGTLDLISADAGASGMIYAFYGRFRMGSTDGETLRAEKLPPAGSAAVSQP